MYDSYDGTLCCHNCHAKLKHMCKTLTKPMRSASQSGKYKFKNQTLREHIHRIVNMNMMLRAAFGMMSFIQDALIIV